MQASAPVPQEGLETPHSSTVAGKGADSEPWHIEADRLTFYHASDVVVGEGAVKVSRDHLSVTADRMLYDMRKAKIWASGAVIIQMGEDVLRGDEGELDLNTMTGTVKDAHLFLKRNNINLVAKQIWKSGPEEYKAEDAVISTCPLPKQAWSFRCKKLDLTITGIAVARHTTFNLRNLPLLYSPWVAVPINRYRKSGFLLPYFSSSSRNGAEITVPFFWAINDSMDATIYQHPMANRGWMEGVEFRHIFSEESKGIFRYNFLVDTLEDYDYNNDGQIRGNEKRWWLRAKADQTLPWDIKAKLDLDLISDRDYLQEFDHGPMGYEETNRIFRKNFGRSLVDDTDLIRPSTLQLTKLFTDSFAGAEGRYNDNQIAGEQDWTVQTMPAVFLQTFRKRILSTPFFYDLKTSYVNYWREAGITEQRYHLEPRLSLPVNLGGFADLLLSGAIEESFYTTGGVDNSLPKKPDDSANRLLYRLEADLSTTLARTYTLESGSQIRHTIRPRIIYQYRPPESQDNLPDIDELDRLEPTNRLTYSLLTFVSSKSLLGKNRYAYSDLLRLKIEQSYDIRESIRDLAPGVERRPFSDVYGEIEVRPMPYMFFRYDTTYNLYGEGFTTYNFLGRLYSPAGDHLNIDYRFNRITDINELNLDLNLAISSSWRGMYRFKRSFAQNTALESEYGLRYQSSCWALEGRLKDDQDETRFTIHLELLGIGGWKGLQ